VIKNRQGENETLLTATDKVTHAKSEKPIKRLGVIGMVKGNHTHEPDSLE
jgi:hypothetical protein